MNSSDRILLAVKLLNVFTVWVILVSAFILAATGGEL